MEWTKVMKTPKESLSIRLKLYLEKVKQPWRNTETESLFISVAKRKQKQKAERKIVHAFTFSHYWSSYILGLLLRKTTNGNMFSLIICQNEGFLRLYIHETKHSVPPGVGNTFFLTTSGFAQLWRWKLKEDYHCEWKQLKQQSFESAVNLSTFADSGNYL